MVTFLQKAVLLLPVICLVGCNDTYSYYGPVSNGIYESSSGYSIHLNDAIYSLCKNEICQIGEIYQKTPYGQIYLINFREKIPKSDKQFPIMLGLDFLTAGGKLQAWERETKNGVRELDNDIAILRYRTSPSGNVFSHCNRYECFLLGVKEHGYDYLFKFKREEK